MSVGTPKNIFAIRGLIEKTTASVLMMTQNFSTGVRMLALKAGVEDVLVKCSNIEYLLARLRSIIRLRHTLPALNVRDDRPRPLLQRTHSGLSGQTQGSVGGFRNQSRAGIDRKIGFRQRIRCYRLCKVGFVCNNA